MNRYGAREGKINNAEALVIIIVILMLAAFAYYGGYIPQNNVVRTTTFHNNNNGNTNPSQGTFSVQTNVYDAMSGSAVTSLSTEKVLSGSATYDSSSSSSNPVQFSAGYQSGQTYTFEVGKSGYVTAYRTMTLPSLALSGGQTYASIPNLYTCQSPTITITAAMQNGTAITSGSTYNFTSSANTQNRFAFTVSNTKSNSCWISGYDPVNAQSTNMVFSLNDTNSNQYLTITGLNKITKGSAAYYPQVLSDGFTGQTCSGGNGPATVSSTTPDGQPETTVVAGIGCTQQVAGGIATITIGQTTVGGQQVIYVTVAQGSLAHGGSETVGISVYKSGDVSVFPSLGTYGTDASSVATFNIAFKA